MLALLPSQTLVRKSLLVEAPPPTDATAAHINAQIRHAVASSHYRPALFNGLLSSNDAERSSTLAAIASAIHSWARSLFPPRSRSASVLSADISNSLDNLSIALAAVPGSLLDSRSSCRNSNQDIQPSIDNNNNNNDHRSVISVSSLPRTLFARTSDTARATYGLTRSASMGHKSHNSSLSQLLHPQQNTTVSVSRTINTVSNFNGDSGHASFSDDGSSNGDDDDKQESMALFHLHLLTILRLSVQCPYADVRTFMSSLLTNLKLQGIPTPHPAYSSPSYFVPLHEIPSFDAPSSNTTLSSLVPLLPTSTASLTTPTSQHGYSTTQDINETMAAMFNSTGRFSNINRMLMYFPSYLEKNRPMIKHILMDLSGPLPRAWRLYIGIMAAAQYQCQSIVSFLSQEFLMAGGNLEWLDGLASVPQKLQNLQELNTLLAHQPWRITPKHICKLTKGTFESPVSSPSLTPSTFPSSQQSKQVHSTTTTTTTTTSTTSQSPSDNWAMSELVQAIVVLTSIHAQSSFSLGCGIVPEVDSEGGFVYDEPITSDGTIFPVSTNNQLSETGLDARLAELITQPPLPSDLSNVSSTPICTNDDSVYNCYEINNKNKFESSNPTSTTPALVDVKYLPKTKINEPHLLMSTSTLPTINVGIATEGLDLSITADSTLATSSIFVFSPEITKPKIELTDQLIRKLKQTQKTGLSETELLEAQSVIAQEPTQQHQISSSSSQPQPISLNNSLACAESAVTRKEVFEKCENLAGLPVEELLGPVAFPIVPLAVFPSRSSTILPRLDTAHASLHLSLPPGQQQQQLKEDLINIAMVNSITKESTTLKSDATVPKVSLVPADIYTTRSYSCAHRLDLAWPPRFADTARFTSPHTQIAYEDFNVKAQDYSVFRLNDWSWEDHGVGMVSKYLGHEVGEILDDIFEEAKHMTDYSLFNITTIPMGGDQSNMATELDTAPFRQAIWYYVLRLYGQCHDDYNYALVNHFLNKRTKSFVKKVACCPQAIQYADFAWMGVLLRPEEKCHLNILVVEAKKQAQLVWALNSVVKYLEQR